MAASEPRIYLDNNATTRPFPEVVDAMASHFRDAFANPGSQHLDGRRARQALERARETIADLLGADPGEVIFTSGGTEAIDTALLGLTAGPEPGTIALTAGEHPATTQTCQILKNRGWTLHTLDVDSDGRLIADDVERLPWDALKLVSVILAHNETGVIQDVGPLARRCREQSIPLHLDAVQAVGKIPVDFHDLGATALSLGAHKFHGPRGIGALLLREGSRLEPLLAGGHQESGRRSGTEPVALAVGMAKALELCCRNQDERRAQICRLRDRLEQGLADSCAPVVVNGSREHRLPNTLNIAFPGIDGEAFLVALDLAGVACSLGSTCASGSAEPAPALLAMACPVDVCLSAVRFSLSAENTEQEIDGAIQRIAAVKSLLEK